MMDTSVSGEEDCKGTKPQTFYETFKQLLADEKSKPLRDSLMK